ncbi:PAS domain S-box protein [Mucilaginibacter limnophilus]|uniref:histidine kinase n=1 Tax=Mucilaginibacter limnophilus TaxID=1932778 RepID=A0A3S2VAC2_9SPHI|nr:PAS domain-containing protein [Mucilaginibacter limnophilus]RVU02697.1 PAS domain S-box protein [Mucilaginibacter limnophilus]
MQETNTNFSFLADGGECGDLIRSINWSETSLGPVDEWPQILKTTLGLILHTKFPMFLFWGPELICFYNDAYRPSLGYNGKHPAAMGQKGEECWPEIWDFIKPLIDNVLEKGQASWYEDQLLPIYRNGRLEDVYWTFSYSPVFDETGKAAGVFVTCNETTEKVKTLSRLEESRDELEFAIDAGELGTWDYNPVTNKFFGNARLKSWFGLPADAELDLTTALNAIAEKDRARVTQAIEQSLQKSSGGGYDVSYTIINPVTRQERFVRAKGKAFFNDTGDAYRLNGTVQDITDDSIARRQLVASESNFKAMVLQAPVAMCVLKGPKFIVEVANDPIYELWGKTAEQMLNKPLFDGLSEVKGQGLEELLIGVLTTGERFVANERPVALPRGDVMEIHYLNFVYAPFRNEDEIIGVIAVATDVTEQVLSSQKIQDAEERARLAMDAVEMGTYDLDFVTSGIITSPRFDQIFGLNVSSTHRDYVSVIHPEDLETRRIAHEVALKTGRLKYIARVIWPDNSIRWMRAVGKVIYDDNGTPLRLLGTAVDITESKQAEEELREINQRLELALEAGNLGSYELNIETGEIICNEQFKSDFGLKDREQFTFSDLINTVAPAFRERVRAAVGSAIKNKNSYNEEFQIICPDGSVHWIRASGKVRYTNEGKPALIIGVSFDITDHKNLQQQKDDFISIASHELKTPVTSIKAYTQVLERMLKQKGDEREAAMIAKMDAQVNRLTSLIGDLLDVTKINSGKLQFNDRVFAFNELVAEVIEELQRTTEKHVLINNVNYTGTVHADRDRIAQVITNLISNAIKYSPLPGNIIVSSISTENEVQLCVQDFGVGIPADKQELVFEQFYRVSGDKQHTFPGLGLGLYISSEILKRENGRIWVNSVEGKGSTFCFALPASPVTQA